MTENDIRIGGIVKWNSLTWEIYQGATDSRGYAVFFLLNQTLSTFEISTAENFF